MNKIIVRLKKYLKNYYMPFFILFILMFFASCRSVIHPGDDEAFRNSFINNGGIIGWFKNYTAIWSGRVIPHFILIVLLNINLIFWRLLNSLMFVIMAIGAYLLVINKDSDDRKKIFTSWIVCSLILFMPYAVLFSGGIWITGSVTYLWPMACAFISIVPFKRLLTGEINSKWMVISSIFASIYASYSEQSAAVMMAFVTLIIGYCFIKKIKVRWYHIFSYIIILINSIYSLTVVGNSVRSQAEELRFYPDFSMLSLVDKIFMGVNVTFNHLFNSGNIYLLLISIFIILIIENKKCDLVTKLMAIIPLLYTFPRFLNVGEIYKFDNINKLYVGGIKQYLSYIAAMMVCLIIIYLFYVIYEKNECIIITLIFLAAMCCSIIMGISPTVYASGSRVFFATDVLLIICNASLFKKYIEKHKVNKILYISFISIALLLAIRFIIYIAPNLVL